MKSRRVAGSEATDRRKGAVCIIQAERTVLQQAPHFIQYVRRWATDL